ncbi:MAG: hypothetical protein L0220_02320, partial [Acidobacteria bacterium]|nr:hypothetical protein [Acidobacteriota bacterium]
NQYQPEIKNRIKTYSALITGIIGFVIVVVTFVKAVKEEVSLFVITHGLRAADLVARSRHPKILTE